MPEQVPRPEQAAGTGGDSPPGMPRWVKVSAAVVGLLILLFLVLQLAGVGGDHGPGRHMSGQAPASLSVSAGTSGGAPAPAGSRA